MPEKICKCGKPIREYSNNLFENFVTLDDFEYPVHKKHQLCKLIKNIQPYCNHIQFDLKTLDILSTDVLPDDITLEEILNYIDTIGPLCYEEHDTKCYKKVLLLTKGLKNKDLSENLKHLLNSKLSLHDIPLISDYFIQEFLDYKFKYMSIAEYEDYIWFNNKKKNIDDIFDYLGIHKIREPFQYSSYNYQNLMFKNFLYAENMEVCIYIKKNILNRADGTGRYFEYPVIDNRDWNSASISYKRFDFLMRLLIRLNNWDLFKNNWDSIKRDVKTYSLSNEIMDEFKTANPHMSIKNISLCTSTEIFEEYCKRFKEILKLAKHCILDLSHIPTVYDPRGSNSLILLNVKDEEMCLKNKITFSNKVKTETFDYKSYNYSNEDFKKLVFFIMSQKNKILKSFGNNTYFHFSKSTSVSGHKCYTTNVHFA